MTRSELLRKIERFEKLLDDFNISNLDSRELWRLRKELFEDFKDVGFDYQHQREEAWEQFMSLGKLLKEKQNSLNEELEKIAEETNEKLDNIDTALFGRDLSKKDFGEIKEKMNEISFILKKYRWPSREMKDKAWEKSHSLWTKLKEKENKFYGDIKEKKIDHSAELTTKILYTIDACDPNSAIEVLIALLSKLVLYATGLGFIFDFVDWLTGTKDKPENPLKIKSQALKDIRKFIHENKDDITKEDKQKIFERLDTVQDDLNQAWVDYKEQKENKKHEWERKQREFLSKLESRLANQIGYKSKLEGVLEKQQNFVEKLEKRLTNQQDYLKKQENRLDDLEDKYNDAHSDNFRDKVSGWIDEAEGKISEVESDIEQLEEKIKDVNNNIEELPDKIRNLENDIEELEGKIEEVRSKLND
jgi:archaellum component FlaC